jgi:hypothetical protein
MPSGLPTAHPSPLPTVTPTAAPTALVATLTLLSPSAGGGAVPVVNPWDRLRLEAHAPTAPGEAVMDAFAWGWATPNATLADAIITSGRFLSLPARVMVGDPWCQATTSYRRQVTKRVEVVASYLPSCISCVAGV